MINNISTDWGVSPRIVRIVTTDDLAVITTAGYVTAQAANIELIQNGNFEWTSNDEVLISYGDGQGFFTYDAATAAFVAQPTAPGSLSDDLTSAHIFVGNGGNVATDTPMTGDVHITNTGVTTIQNDAVATVKILNANVTLAKLAAGITPSHVIKFAAQPTTVGGAAAEAFVVAGVLNTDLAFVQIVDNGAANVTALQAVCTANTLTVTFSADPGNDVVINYQIIRAAA